MENFTATVEDERTRVRLEDSLQGRGAFSRFKNFVETQEPLRSQWFAFKNEAYIQWVRRQLQALDVQIAD